MNHMLLSDEAFESSVLGSEVPVVLAICVPGSAASRALDPVMDGLEREYAGEAVIAKVDALRSADLVERLSIDAVPTLVFFQEGRVVDRLIGAVPRDEIVERLDVMVARTRGRCD